MARVSASLWVEEHAKWQEAVIPATRLLDFPSARDRLRVFAALFPMLAPSRSHRYDGQQVNPSQAQALFNARGWDTRDVVRKALRHAGVMAVTKSVPADRARKIAIPK